MGLPQPPSMDSMSEELSAQSCPVPSPSHPSDPETDVEVLREIPREFAIVDQQSANWVVRRIKSARDYGDNVRIFADRELARAEREERVLMFLFERQLSEWAKGEIAKFKGKRKSLNLPAASIGFRTNAPKLVIDDEQTVMSWAREHLPTAVILIEKVMKSILDQHFKTTGELPPRGAHVEPAFERFFVR